MHDIAMTVLASADPSKYPLAHRLVECCDAVLWIAGESRGGDLDVARALQLGLPAHRAMSDPPPRTDILGAAP